MGERKTVLIVDDNETLLLALEFNLQRAGYHVFKATDGNEALAIARKEHPDIIVSDIAMPEMDGIELCRQLRSMSEFTDVPFIFLTAHGEPEERVKGLRTGADDYVVKPFDIEELITRIDILYEKTKQRKVTENLAGRIEEISIADILQVLEQTGKEGKVLIKTDKREGAIFIKRGMVTCCEYGDLRGEDAFVELMQKDRGSFTFKPQEVDDSEGRRPVGFMVMESVRLIDEYQALSSFIPSDSDTVTLLSIPEADSPDMEKIISALLEGSMTVGDLPGATGLSRIRVLTMLAKFLRDGNIEVRHPDRLQEEQVPQEVSTTVHLQMKPVKLLFLFCDEKAASETINSILSAFGQRRIKGIKAGLADFVKAEIMEQPVHIFTLQGKRGYEFLYEPLLPTSDAILYLINCKSDHEEYRFFLKKIETAGKKPCFPITSSALSVEDEKIWPVRTEDQVKELFLTLYRSL